MKNFLFFRNFILTICIGLSLFHPALQISANPISEANAPQEIVMAVVKLKNGMLVNVVSSPLFNQKPIIQVTCTSLSNKENQNLLLQAAQQKDNLIDFRNTQREEIINQFNPLIIEHLGKATISSGQMYQFFEFTFAEITTKQISQFLPCIEQ